MRRACRRSARILARVVLPTRRGPSTTRKRGGSAPARALGARLAAVESGALIGIAYRVAGAIIAECLRSPMRDTQACAPVQGLDAQKSSRHLQDSVAKISKP